MVTGQLNNPTDNSENKLLEFEILDSLKEFIGSEPFGQYLSEYINNTLTNIDRLGHAIAAEDISIGLDDAVHPRRQTSRSL